MGKVTTRCPECDRVFSAKKMKCPHCGHDPQFQERVKKYEKRKEEFSADRLIACSSCKAEINLYAKSCPQCGALNRVNPALKVAAFLGVGVAVVWGFFFLVFVLPLILLAGYAGWVFLSALAAAG